MDRRNNYPRRPNIRSAARPSYDGRPLPAEVYYRRRRLAALFALLVVIGVVATLLFIRSNHESATVAVTEPITSTPRATGGAPATPTGSPKATSASGGGAGSEPAAEVATEVATTPGTAAGTRTGGASGASGVGGKKSVTHTTAASDDAQADDAKDDDAESEAAQANDTCDLSDLKIEASTDHFSYEEGQLPNLYMKVANPTKADCIIDLTDNVIRFEIYTMDTNGPTSTATTLRKPASKPSKPTPNATSRCNGPAPAPHPTPALIGSPPPPVTTTCMRPSASFTRKKAWCTPTHSPSTCNNVLTTRLFGDHPIIE